MHTLYCSILSIICTLSLFGAEAHILQQFRPDFDKWGEFAQESQRGCELCIIASMMHNAGIELRKNGGPITDQGRAHSLAMEIARRALESNRPITDDPNGYAQRIVHQATSTDNFRVIIIHTVSDCHVREKLIDVAIDLVVCSSIIRVLQSGNPAGIYSTTTRKIHRRKSKGAVAKAIEQHWRDFFEKKVVPSSYAANGTYIISPDTIQRLRQAIEEMDLAAWLIASDRQDNTVIFRF